MSISDSVKQAISAGAIAQSTINSLGQAVATSADTRALAILADAIQSGMVSVTEDCAAAAT